MKKMLAMLLAATFTLAAQAEIEFKNLPPQLQKSLRGNSLKSAQLQDGVLRLQMDKPEVTELVYGTFVFHNVCAEQWHHPAEFARWGLARVELLNATANQGFAFDARGDVCEQMGRLGKNFRTFIAERTVKCEGGTCPRQP